MTPPDAEKPLSAEEVATLEALFGGWWAGRMSGAPWPLESVPEWRLYDRLSIAAINALPRLLATARNANLAYAKGRAEGLEAAAQALEHPSLPGDLPFTEAADVVRALKDAPQGET